MADFTTSLEQLRGAASATEAAATTPSRIISTGPPGNVDISGVLKRMTIEDRRAAGTRTSLRNTYSGIESSDLVLTNIPVSYQEDGWWLSADAPSGAAAGAAVDTTAYTRKFLPVESTTVNTYGTGYRTFNLEYAAQDFASTLVYKMPAMRVTHLAFHFNKRASGTDSGVMMDITLTMGQGVATQGTAFTGSLSLTTPTLVLGHEVVTSVDTSWAGIGGTPDTQITSGTFSLDLPVTYHDGFDGSAQHTSAHYAQQWVPTWTWQRRFSDLTELTAYLAKSIRAVQFKATGDLVGAVSAVNTFQLDGVVSPTDHTITHVDGLVYADLSFEGIYDATLTSNWRVVLTNAVSTSYVTV